MLREGGEADIIRVDDFCRHGRRGSVRGGGVELDQEEARLKAYAKVAVVY